MSLRFATETYPPFQDSLLVAHAPDVIVCIRHRFLVDKNAAGGLCVLADP